jgi:putative spermidine/putrescine transport system substrate-binding protein
MADGVAPKDVYKTLGTSDGVERAFKKLDQLKANLVWWEKGSQPPQLLASGEVAMTDAYNGRIAAANEKDKKNFKIVWTNNLYTIDSWVIMKGSPNKAQAETYLQFVNDPQNQKNLPPKIPYGPTTKASTALIDKNVLPNLATAPQNMASALYINDKFWLENLDKLSQRFNAWVAK